MKMIQQRLLATMCLTGSIRYPWTVVIPNPQCLHEHVYLSPRSNNCTGSCRNCTQISSSSYRKPGRALHPAEEQKQHQGRRKLESGWRQDGSKWGGMKFADGAYDMQGQMTQRQNCWGDGQELLVKELMWVRDTNPSWVCRNYSTGEKLLLLPNAAA